MDKLCMDLNIIFYLRCLVRTPRSPLVRRIDNSRTVPTRVGTESYTLVPRQLLPKLHIESQTAVTKLTMHYAPPRFDRNGHYQMHYSV